MLHFTLILYYMEMYIMFVEYYLNFFVPTVICGMEAELSLDIVGDFTILEI